MTATMSKKDRHYFRHLLTAMKDAGINEQRVWHVYHYHQANSGDAHVDAADACQQYLDARKEGSSHEVANK